MSLRFWIGSNRSNKSDELYKYILDEAAANPKRQYLVIVPEQYNLSVLGKLVKMSEREGIFNIDVLSFMRLSHRILDEVGDSANPNALPIDDMGKNLIIRRMASLCESELKTFKGSLNRLGYISEIKSLISEFMQYGISKEQVAQLSELAQREGRSLLSSKLEDAALIYGKFLEFIRDRYDTNEEILNRVSKVVHNSSTVKDSVIVFEGYTGFTPVQINLIKTLLEYAKEINVSLIMNPKDVSHNSGVCNMEELFYLNQKTMSKLGSLADECHVTVEDNRTFDNAPDDISMLNRLEEGLFRKSVQNNSNDDEHTASQDNSDVAGDNQIGILSASNPYEEIRLAAGKINELVRTRGYRYKDIAIVTGDIEGYRNALERVLSEHSIPHFIDKTQPILHNPFTELIRALIETECDNYSYEAVFRMLKTYIVGIDASDVDVLENYVIAKGIKGRKAWHSTWTVPSRDVDAIKLDDVNKIREEVISILASFEEETHIERADTKVSASSCTRGLRRVFAERDLENRLYDIADDFGEKGDYEKQKEYSKVFEFTEGLLTQIEEILGEEKITAGDFKELIDAGLDEIRIGVLPGRTDYVQVGDLTRSRVNDVKALFIVGVNDGIIPGSDKGSGIISDMEREFLIKECDNLELAPTLREKTFTQRVYLYMMMTKPSEKLFLSYSATSFDGKVIRQSYLIPLVMKMFPNVKPESLGRSLSAKITDRADWFNELTMNMRSFVDSKKNSYSDNEYLWLLSTYSKATDNREYLTQLINSSLTPGYDNGEDALSKAVAKALYGKKILTSITRLESYANCAYNYYLKYVLKLDGREEFTFEASDLGSIFHDSLDKYFNRLKAGKIDIKTVSDDIQNEIMDMCVKEAIDNNYEAKMYSSARMSYMVNRIQRIMRKTASVIRYQLTAGEFETESTEVIFDAASNLNALKIKLDDETYMNLTGKIDRLDLAKDGNEVIVRVIDYKSSGKDIDLAAVYEGRQLQLVVYLNAAMEMIRNKGKNARCGGILYYHIDDPVIDREKANTDEALFKEVAKSLRLQGLVNADDRILDMMDKELRGSSLVIPVRKKVDGEVQSNSILTDEQFDILGKYVTESIKDMGAAMLEGNITSRAQFGEDIVSSDKCKYCDYKSVCKVRMSKMMSVRNDEHDLKGLSSDEIIALMKDKAGRD